LIFDTDILIWFLRKHSGAAHFVEDIPLSERRLSAISRLELLYGCRNREDLSQVELLVEDSFAEIIPLTAIITASAQQLMERFVLARCPHANDVLIAATALSGHELLGTANCQRFDFIPGLELKIFRP